MATVAARGAQDLLQVRDRVLDAISEAEADNFRVGGDLSVADAHTYTAQDFALYLDRQAKAEEHQSYIMMRAGALQSLDTEIGAKLNAGATTLDGMIPLNWGYKQSPPDAPTDAPPNDRQDPDGWSGRRLQADEVFGREEGGDRGADHTSSDWPGQAILERYLLGGDDWKIIDDPEWTKYMMDNQLLREQLLDPTQTVAQDALNRYLDGAGATGTFEQRFHAEIENGEGVVGYQYLHGTDQTVGDFHFFGDTAVRPLPDGTYEVTLNSRYTWNDIIDPNPIYSTDQTKSRYAELLSLGRADPYRLAIAWHAPSTVILDGAGNVLEIKGYPAP